MKQLISRWKTSLFAAVVAVAATVFALDYALIDLATDPPEVVSVSGALLSCERTDDGLMLAVDGGEDVIVTLSGVPLDADIAYAVLSADGVVLDGGQGLFVPLSDWPDAAVVLLTSPSGEVDWSAVESVDASVGGRDKRDLPEFGRDWEGRASRGRNVAPTGEGMFPPSSLELFSGNIPSNATVMDIRGYFQWAGADIDSNSPFKVSYRGGREVFE